MKTRSNTPVLAGIGLVTVVALLVIGLLWHGKRTTKHKEIPMVPDFHLTSPAFDDGTAIPAKYTCKGVGISPPLEFSGIPELAKGLAIVLHNPDAPSGDFLHWTIWDINAAVTSVPEGSTPVGATEGTNDFGKVGYGAPCPPSGTHHYIFDAYALDGPLDLPTGATRQEVMEALQAHAIGRTQLTGTFSAP
jgi:Raf kinase inhibitor-like YbhB/YbcL family protein